MAGWGSPAAQDKGLGMALKDLPAGVEPRGLNPRSQRVRSARFTAPAGLSLEEAAREHVEARAVAYAGLAA
jgi:hypothetical protein